MLGYLVYAVRALIWSLRNSVRRLKRVPDYVVFVLEGSYPELPPRRETLWQRLLGPPQTSLRVWAARFRAVARDPRIQGVILHVRALNMPLARLQTLRELIGELRQAGKRVIAWASHYDHAGYYVACTADEVLIQPGGSIEPLGIHQGVVFLADALEQIGIKADFLQISPYKTGLDSLRRSEMSEEMRAMMNWLLDDLYAEQLQAISQGRECTQEAAQALIDDSPYTDLQAKEKGLIDGILNEEGLPEHLAVDGKPARLAQWDGARGRVLLPLPPRMGRYVALLRIEGDIVDGRSQRPPRKPPFSLPFLLNERAGDLTIVQEARRVLRDPRAAAVVVYIESGGGSATASEAMTDALKRVAEERPLVVSLGPVAGSGGYYVATPGRWIVAQPGTLTGSIGVLYGKLVSGGMLEKLHINRERISRGARAAFYDPGQPFTEEEHDQVWRFIQRIYDVFLDRVSSSRHMSREEVDAIGGGRVWTGRQALERGLVDELGGFERAVAKARELAGLSEWAPVREIIVPAAKTPLAPWIPATNLFSYALEGLKSLGNPRALCLCPWTWDETA